MSDKAFNLLQHIIKNNDIKSFPICCDSNVEGKIREISNTITARYNAGIQNHKQIGLAVIGFNGKDDNLLKIRRLTPRECWRLQGQSIYKKGIWDDTNFEKAQSVCSDSQLFKQAGNSITVDVLCHIFKSMEEQGLM